MKKYLPDYLFLFLTAGVIIVFDQITKFWIRDTLSLGQIYRPDLWFTEYIRLIHWQNTGAAFGMFQNANPIFMTLSSIVSLIIIYYFHQVPREDHVVRLAMALLLGGAVGNLIDRIHQQHVTDFVSVMQFPVFNVADASISTGVAILFIGMWFQERARAHAQQAATPDAAGAAAPNGSGEVFQPSETVGSPLTEESKSE